MKVLIAISLSLLLVSCLKKDSSGEKVVNLVVEGKVKGMDPIHTGDGASLRETARIYEGLLRYAYLKRPYKLEPDLAEAMPTVSKDGRTYTFKIKKGIFFQHDKAFPGGKGRELVAKDFVYSIKRLANARLRGTGWWILKGRISGLDQWRKKYTDKPANYDEVVEGVRALDKYTLQFKLSKSYPQFLYALAMPYTYAVAREVVEHYGEEFLNHPVGTGPFVLKKRDQNLIIYTVNPDYRQRTFPCKGSAEFQHMIDVYCGKKLPLVEKVAVNVIVESQPAWLKLQKGKLDLVNIPKDNFSSIIPDAKTLSPEYAEKGMEFIFYPSMMVSYISFNHDLKLFRNVYLRRAMSLAYDVQRANKLFYNGTALKPQSVVPPGLEGYLKGVENPYVGEGKPQNIALAKKLLKKAGYPGGKGLPVISLDMKNGTENRRLGEYFKKQMAQIGVRIKVQQNTWPQLLKRIINRQVMLHYIAWIGDYPDAENFLQLLYGPNRSPGPNGSGYNNPKLNKIYERVAVMHDSPTRVRLYEKLNRMVMNEMPWIFLHYRQTYKIKNKWLKNLVAGDYEQGNSIYFDVDMEQKAKLLRTR